jgi:4-hydroxymandelate oxidase
MAHPEGELAAARAAGAAGSIYVLATLSTTSVESVVGAAGGPVWFQLYVYKDRAVTTALVRRAEAAGCSALVLTVTAPSLVAASATCVTPSSSRLARTSVPQGLYW